MTKEEEKKMERGRGGVFILKILHKLIFLASVYVATTGIRKKTSDLLRLVFSVMKSHKTINPASYTTVQDVFPFLGLDNPGHMNYQDDSSLFFFYCHKNSRYLKSKQRCDLSRALRAVLL